MRNYKTVFVTGAAGFIGSNLILCLFRDVENITIVGIDNMNGCNDVALKNYRLDQIEQKAPAAK